ncbi:DUF4238 domain-containing protein [Citrobacter portucalensis]|uniref:DUF4238 domain-containing protein n=1 Tax=Citrobacter portucalensis TaxID=1639133 RepID=UPI001EDB08E2|nr:DUF4238 domain-containing protein [Citrobacter portucalensis]UKK88127.1 DUF4238 domain-containing protein [Citrobacter portucalensis]
MLDLKKIFTPTKTKKQHTIKQHFIPQVYIKRFYNESFKVFRHDVKNNRTKEFTSSQIFYEPELYNLVYKQKIFRDIENSYSDLESMLGKIYEAIDAPAFLKNIKEDKALNKSIFLFFKTVISYQYFRTKDIDYRSFIPHSTALTDIYRYREKYIRDNFSFIKKKDLKYIQKKVTKNLRNNEQAVKVLVKGLQLIILPILLTNFISTRLKIHRYEKKYIISCDKPIICKSRSDLYNLQNFIYPLSPDVIIYAEGNEITSSLIQNYEAVNQLIFNNAEKYIISHDKKIIDGIRSKK